MLQNPGENYQNPFRNSNSTFAGLLFASKISLSGLQQFARAQSWSVYCPHFIPMSTVCPPFYVCPAADSKRGMRLGCRWQCQAWVGSDQCQSDQPTTKPCLIETYTCFSSWIVKLMKCDAFYRCYVLFCLFNKKVQPQKLELIYKREYAT